MKKKILSLATFFIIFSLMILTPKQEAQAFEDSLGDEMKVHCTCRAFPDTGCYANGDGSSTCWTTKRCWRGESNCF
ncbi:MAG: hypothetical protein KGZ97_04500 [Bacteroidetes bacterium]|nr:hypothetical protein [Bacteroidota bacterium]